MMNLGDTRKFNRQPFTFQKWRLSFRSPLSRGFIQSARKTRRKKKGQFYSKAIPTSLFPLSLYYADKKPAAAASSWSYTGRPAKPQPRNTYDNGGFKIPDGSSMSSQPDRGATQRAGHLYSRLYITRYIFVGVGCGDVRKHLSLSQCRLL